MRGNADCIRHRHSGHRAVFPGKTAPDHGIHSVVHIYDAGPISRKYSLGYNHSHGDRNIAFVVLSPFTKK